MPLSPEDVRNKQFTTTRLREGYDEDEVDSFLDKVEAELTRLLRENQELRAKLAAVTGPNAKNQQNANNPPEQSQPQSARSPSALPAGIPGPPQQTGGPSNGTPQLAARSGGQDSSQGASAMGQVAGGGDGAARVLALAQRTADHAIAEARSEANKILGEARLRAEGIERDARARADALDRDAQEKHRVAIGSLESARATLERRVEDLRGFEHDYRSRLKSYLESQLRHLELEADSPQPPPRVQAASPLPPFSTPSGVSASHGGSPPPPPPPPYGGQRHMNAAQPQHLAQAQAHPQGPPPISQAPSPMHGYLLDDDDSD